MPQKRMEGFRLLLEHLAWIKHQFLSDIRDSRKAGITSQTLQIELVALPPGQYTSPQLHSCHRLFEQDGVSTQLPTPYSPDHAPCDFCLFPKLRGCRYETIEEMKEAVTKVIDTLTQEDFHGALQKLLERYNKFSAAGGDYFEGN